MGKTPPGLRTIGTVTVVYEILTGRDPYHVCQMFTATAKVASDRTLNRPEIVTNDKI